MTLSAAWEEFKSTPIEEKPKLGFNESTGEYRVFVFFSENYINKQGYKLIKKK